MHRFANPARFLRLSAALRPWALGVALLTLLAGVWLALFDSPPDYQQGETVRIMYIHVPAAWMAMMVYATMAVASVVGLVWKHVVAELYTKAAAPLGAGFTTLCLVSGSLWGQPMWGTWWVWDARLTSTLILFFLYLGFMALQAAIDDPRRADKAGAIVAIVGVVNVPIIYFSVKWWNTLHQGASVSVTKSPSMAALMLWAMLIMAVAFWMYSIAVALARVRNIILERERQNEWVRHAVA
jgi:heme exporter protein C